MLETLFRSRPQTGAQTQRVGLQYIAERLRRHESADTLVAIVTHAHAIGVFNHQGQALELVGTVCEGFAAGVYETLEFDEPESDDGVRYVDWSNLRGVDLASLLCMLVCCCLHRRYMGATFIQLLVRDCETSITVARLEAGAGDDDHHAA